MPRGNRTGPAGMGPMTGRGLGYCAGYGAPGYANPAPGFGLGRDPDWRGGGRGWRHQYYATGLPGWARFGYALAWRTGPGWRPMTTDEEVELLKHQAQVLQQELDAVAKRLVELEKEE
jgi:hypothetical protein